MGAGLLLGSKLERSRDCSALWRLGERSPSWRASGTLLVAESVCAFAVDTRQEGQVGNEYHTLLLTGQICHRSLSGPLYSDAETVCEQTLFLKNLKGSRKLAPEVECRGAKGIYKIQGKKKKWSFSIYINLLIRFIRNMAFTRKKWGALILGTNFLSQTVSNGKSKCEKDDIGKSGRVSSACHQQGVPMTMGLQNKNGSI
jgi:hypothetical protein